VSSFFSAVFLAVVFFVVADLFVADFVPAIINTSFQLFSMISTKNFVLYFIINLNYIIQLFGFVENPISVFAILIDF
jgi:hypothetical protein